MRGSSFRFRTVRAKLAAVTLFAFAVVIALVTTVSFVISRQALLSSIDHDLERRGSDFALEVAQRDGAGPPTGPPGGTPGGPPDSGPPGGGPGGGPGEGSPNRRRPNPDWIAPAAIPVGSSERNGGPYSTAYDPIGFALAAKGNSVFTTVRVEGEPRRVFSAPARRNGRVSHVVQVAYVMGPALQTLDDMRWTMLEVVVPLGLLIGGLATFFVMDRMLRPVRRINTEAVRIGKSGFGERLGTVGDDEFASLADTLNGMLGNLEAVYRSEHEANARLQESIEQQRRFTGDASHELKTPLSVVKAYLGVLKGSKRTVAEESETIRTMERATDRMSGLIGDLLILARSDSGITGERTICPFDDILVDAARSLPNSEIRIRLHLEPGISIYCAESEMVRVFTNLVENGIKHSGSSEPIEVSLARRGEKAVVTVRDHGTGISPEHLSHLFERFYRVDRSRTSASGGAGLGLAICDQIVRSHMGEISVRSEIGKGTEFTVTLPVARE